MTRWRGVCIKCKEPIEFDDHIKDDHTYTCKCNQNYWLDRRLGIYIPIGTNSIDRYRAKRIED